MTGEIASSAVLETLSSFPGWELEALGLANPKKTSRLDRWFQFLAEESPELEGDIAEFGVFRGSSLVPAALILREVAPHKTVWGFDSFNGFPALNDPHDDFTQFSRMARKGEISSPHFEEVTKARDLRREIGLAAEGFDVISSSMNFSGTSRALVEFRTRYFGLDNVNILQGYFEETISLITSANLSGILLDSDLYAGYKVVLGTLSDLVSQGGIVFLDEYYSLKFPGPRIAVNEFLAKNPGVYDLETHHEVATGFERNWLRKL